MPRFSPYLTFRASPTAIRFRVVRARAQVQYMYSVQYGARGDHIVIIGRTKLFSTRTPHPSTKYNQC